MCAQDTGSGDLMGPQEHETPWDQHEPFLLVSLAWAMIEHGTKIRGGDHGPTCSRFLERTLNWWMDVDGLN